jgi:serine/threonine protein kinase
MLASKQFNLESIGIDGLFTIPSIPTIELSMLARYDGTDSLFYANRFQRRCFLRIEHVLDHGSYGNIYLGKRDDVEVLLKQPRMVEMNLFQEAVLQHLAHKTLEAEGIGWAIPKVYDVFWNKKEVWFSMEHIHGYSVEEWFRSTKTADTDLFYLLAQLSLILATLESHLNLDHRDLKSSNLILKREPCKIHVKIHDVVWTLLSPFTVVVLDFGFACLGSEVLRGKPWVNLGDGVLPPMDPCPKEGRDMFHLLTSFLGLPILQQAISKRLHDKIDGWLTLGKKTYGPMARRWSTENWSYLVSSQPNFAIPNCCPLRILQDILPELKGYLFFTQAP